MSATSAEKDRLDGNLDDFRSLLDTARLNHRRGRSEAAAAYAQAAAAFAWTNHTGLFGSDELETILSGIGEGIPGRTGHGRSRRVGVPRTILHVLTQAYPTGGHSQAVACWMEQDAGPTHRVCLTRQGAAPVPRKIVDRLRSGSDLVRLDSRYGDLPARAAALRNMARRHDLVLLHLHPYDVVPVLAFAGMDDLPPVVFVDHSDHTFWIGATGAATLVSMRNSGMALAIDRRGVDPGRCRVLSRPLRLEGRAHDREVAKRRLGLQPDDVLVVTAADASKYRPIAPPGLLDMIVPFFTRHPRAHLLAAGPLADGDWADAERRTEGRIRALGVLTDVTPLHEAADIYLDSYPFSSLTSLMEAGSLGNPTVSYRGHPADCAVLGADTPGVDEHIIAPSTPPELDAVLERLVSDVTWRAMVGERTQDAIVDSHTGAGWREAAEQMYEAAADARGSFLAGPPTRRTTSLDVLVSCVMERTGHAQGVPGAIRDNLGLFPFRERTGAARRLLDAGPLPAPRSVMSESLRLRLGRMRRIASATTGRNP